MSALRARAPRRRENLFRIVLHQARFQPDVVAISDGTRTLTYRELAALAQRTAGHLAGLGLRPGGRIGICLKDHWEHVVLLLAIGLAGLVIVPIDWRARGAEKRAFAGLLSLKLVVVEPEDALDMPCPVVAVDDAWRRATAAAVPLADIHDDWHAPLIIAQTAGTTGPPRFSLATHLQMYFRTVMTVDTAPRTGPQRYLSALPLCFAVGHQRCLIHLLKGDSLVLIPALFTATEFADAVARHGIQVAFAVPTLVRQLIQVAPADRPLFPGLEALFCGGAPLFAEEKHEAAHRLTPHFFFSFGTSATGGLTRLRPHELATHADSVGRPHPLVEIEIVDENDRPLGSDAVGRLRARGPGLGIAVASGEEPAARNEDIRDGWCHTGDLGAIGADGYLHIKGRTTDVIMRGGAKIMPAEIEAVLHQHAAVAEAAVLGRIAADNEQEIVAFVVARGPVEAGDLLAHCRAHLTAYKMPREIRLIAQLPRNTAGKVAKLELAKLLVEGGRRP